MKLLIAAVGRMKPSPELDLVERYVERARPIARSLGISEVSVLEVESRKRKAAQRIDEEAELLLGSVPAGSRLIALDERGDSLATSKLAGMIDGWRSEASPAAAFLIGGADGHGAAVSRAAHGRLAFGAAVWPHMLVRGMVCEQIYRCLTILAGHPYHRV